MWEDFRRSPELRNLLDRVGLKMFLAELQDLAFEERLHIIFNATKRALNILDAEAKG